MSGNIGSVVNYLLNLNTKDEGIKSILSQYKAGKTLTEKQNSVLIRNYENHKKANDFFKKGKELNDFQISLKNQFKTKGFLTQKQLDCLLRT